MLTLPRILAELATSRRQKMCMDASEFHLQSEEGYFLPTGVTQWPTMLRTAHMTEAATDLSDRPEHL